MKLPPPASEVRSEDLASAYEAVRLALGVALAETAALREQVEKSMAGNGGGGGSGRSEKSDASSKVERLRQEAAAKRRALSERRKKRRGQQRPTVRNRGKRTVRTIPIDTQMTISVPTEQLPSDSGFKGYRTRRFQETAFERRNVEMRREKYVSPVLGVIVAPLPDGWSGEFGPNVHVLIHTMYRDHAGGDSYVSC